MNTLIIVKIKNTTYDEWKKKFDADAEVQSQMMRNTIVGKVDDNTAMISTEVFNPDMVGQFMSSDEFKQKQENLLKETLKKIDIVICTALIPGKKAPIIIKKDMIEVMQSGSVIYDLAASQGGNSELTKVNEIIEHNGVKIMGDSNILNKLPNSASNLYAKNMFNFVSNLYDKENKKININIEDEIIEKTQIK